MADTTRKQEAERDRELVRKTKAGQTEAFRELVELYQGRIFRLISNIIRDEEEAKDVTQEVFVKVYLSLKDFRETSSFFTWAYRIAFNFAVDWKRKYGKIVAKTDSQHGDSVEEVVAQLPSDERLPDEVLYQQEQRTAIQDAFRQMSEEQRTVVVLREVDGLSYEEISEVTGLPKGTVMSRLFYGRQNLMELLSKFRMKEEEDTSNMGKRGVDPAPIKATPSPKGPFRVLRSVTGS